MPTPGLPQETRFGKTGADSSAVQEQLKKPACTELVVVKGVWYIEHVI